MGNVVHAKEKLVDEMESNDFDPYDSDLRRGSNVIQGLISNKKRRMNRTPRTPLGLKKILEGSPGAEDNTEGSDSDSLAYNPTSLAYPGLPQKVTPMVTFVEVLVRVVTSVDNGKYGIVCNVTTVYSANYGIVGKC